MMAGQQRRKQLRPLEEQRAGWLPEDVKIDYPDATPLINVNIQHVFASPKMIKNE
jgi:hypothetical protein